MTSYQERLDEHANGGHEKETLLDCELCLDEAADCRNARNATRAIHTYLGVEFDYEFSKDQGVCPMCEGDMHLVEGDDGYLCRSCSMCDSFSGLPLVDAVYRMNADMRIAGGEVIELEDIDPIEISGKLVDRVHEGSY
jgi:hypothetical protein